MATGFASTPGALAGGLLVAVLATGMPAQAAGQPPVPAGHAAGIAAQFPANSPGARDRLASQLIALGETELAALARQVSPEGGGRDTAVRYALNAVAVHAARFGAEGQRALVERALLAGLASATSVEARTFLLSQLQIVGRDAAIAASAPLLTDPALVEPATQLMLAVKGSAASQALVTALGHAQGPARVPIVRALGALKVVEAHDRILAVARDADPSMRRAALAALARLADPRSAKPLVDGARRAGFAYDPTNASASLIDYARALASRDPDAAAKLCRQIMKETDRAGRLATRAAALHVLSEIRGADALPDLIAAVDHADRTYRHAALRAAESIDGIAAVRLWTAKAEKVTAERRAEIVAMLGRQGDRHSLPYIRRSLGARDPGVVVAAAEALARMEGADAVADVLPALGAADGAAAFQLVGVLHGIVDDAHLDPVVEGFDALSVNAKSAVLTLIGSRGATRFADLVFRQAAVSDEALRKAALAALPGVVTAADLPRLLPLLDGVEQDLIGAVQIAVGAAAQTGSGGGRVRPLVDAMKVAAHPERIVDVLPQVGGAEALAAAASQIESPVDEVRAAALRALTRWPGTEATDRLFALFLEGDASSRNQAFAAYVRQISSSALPADQKLLRLRKILDHASTVGDRRILIRALERIRTFKSLLLIAPFLDDAEAGADAAVAVGRIALPTAEGANDGLAGGLVRDILTRAAPLANRTQRDVVEDHEAAIRRYLAAMPAGEGYVPLVSGTDLSGWQGLVENPLVRARLAPQDLAVKQAEADARMREHWSVRDGAILSTGKGDNLCTVREFGDFELLVDWRITAGGDSGIYLRGAPQVQIWDPARTDVGAQVGSGGLYNNQKNPSRPLVRADNPVGEWNTLRIIMIGDTATVFLNGTLVVDRVTMENYWDRAQPIFARGPIELQAHGTDLAFRDVYVRELGPEGYHLTEEERAEGFVALFNGRDFAGWVGNTTGYTVQDGAIVFDPTAKDRSNLYTEREYADFQFRFEFQLTAGANSGVGIRAPREGDAAYVGMEVQVLDDDAPQYAALQPYQYHGSVYGVIPARRGALRPAGEWNAEEILVRGSRIRVTLNGTVILDGDLSEATRNGPMDRRPHPGLERASGHIGWLSHDTVVRFRNVRIRDLSPSR